MLKTVSNSTVSTYARLRKNLLRHAQKLVERGEMDANLDDVVKMAAAFYFREPGLKAASARLYRAAVLRAPELKEHPQAWEIEDLLLPFDDETRFERSEFLRLQREDLQRRGPAQKAVSLSLGDLCELRLALEQSPKNSESSKYGAVASSWLAATVLTGLRPCEWAGARLTGMEFQVSNAKATQGRAHGETRTMTLGSAAEREVVERHLRLMQCWLQEVTFQELYEGVRKTIWACARKLWRNRQRYPTLYTARHMFAANAKSTLPREAVSALLGHGSIESAARHYAPARCATGSVGVRPSERDLEAVQQRNRNKAEEVQCRGAGQERGAGPKE